MKVLTITMDGNMKMYFHAMLKDDNGKMAPYWMPFIDGAAILTDEQAEALKDIVLPKIQAKNVTHAFEEFDGTPSEFIGIKIPEGIDSKLYIALMDCMTDIQIIGNPAGPMQFQRKLNDLGYEIKAIKP